MSDNIIKINQNRVTKLENLANNIKLLNSKVRKLKEEYLKIDIEDEHAMKIKRRQAVEAYKALKHLKSELKKEHNNLVRSLDKAKNTLCNSNDKNANKIEDILASIDGIFKKNAKQAIDNNYLEKKLNSFKVKNSDKAVKRQKKEMMANTLDNEYKKSLMLGASAGSLYFLIDYFGTRSLEPYFTSKEYSTVTTTESTATVESTTPVEDTTGLSDFSDIYVDTGEEGTGTASEEAVNIVVEEVVMELVVDELLLSLATMSAGIGVAILVAKILYFASKYINEKPVQEKIKYGEHTANIMDHAGKDFAVAQIEHISDSIKEFNKDVNHDIAGESRGRIYTI